MGNKILALEEVVKWNRGPIWLQEKSYNFSYVVIYDLENSPYLRFKICNAQQSDRRLKYVTAQYGKSWRCFDRKPSPSDLAQPFEEAET